MRLFPICFHVFQLMSSAAKTLDKAAALSEDSYNVDNPDTDFNVSGDVEGIISDLLDALQDRVR